MVWDKSRVSSLKDAEIRQLRANAELKGNAEVVAICDDVLGSRPKPSSRKPAARQRELDGRPLVSRAKAFEMRGVKLRNPRWSWGGVRPADGIVVFTVWATDIQKDGASRNYLLFGPDRGGDRPWSDTAGGRERLEHCRLAVARGEAEGLLIYGERRGRDVPLEEASRVTGADPHTVLRFKVSQKADEYWASWSVAK